MEKVGKWAKTPQTPEKSLFFRARFPIVKWANGQIFDQKPEFFSKKYMFLSHKAHFFLSMAKNI